MINKLKKILFLFFKKISNFLIKTRIHKKIPAISFLYDFLFRHLWSDPEIIEIQGSKMYLNVREADLSMRKTFQSYATDKIHEKETTDLFKKNLKIGDVVLDLGANIGYFTLLAARIVGKKGRIYSFEPEPKNYKYLIKNIDLNGYNNIFPFQKAVSNKNGITDLFLCPYDTGHHTINQKEGIDDYHLKGNQKIEKIKIETVVLDDFIGTKEKRIDVIKMDVEGAEALVFQGMEKIINENKDIKIFFEFYPLLIKKMGNSPRELIQTILEDYLFSVFVIPSDYDASQNKIIKINNADELLNLCQKEDSHLNLYLKRGNETL